MVDELNPDFKDVDEAEEAILKLKESNKVPTALPKRELDFYYSEVGSLWSDKTMLSMAMARALAKGRGVDMLKVTEEHVLALGEAVTDGTSESWPTTTRISIQSVAVSNTMTESEAREKDFLESKMVSVPSHSSITYFTSGNDSSLSDGFLPKLSLLALYYASLPLGTGSFKTSLGASFYSRDRKWWELQRIISLTHTHPLAIVCGIAWCTFVERLVRMEDLAEVEDYVFRQVLLMELFSLASELENEYDESLGLLSKTLSWIISNVDNLDVESLANKIRHSNRQCLVSLSWTLGLFLLEGISPRLSQLTRSYTEGAVMSTSGQDGRPASRFNGDFNPHSDSFGIAGGFGGYEVSTGSRRSGESSQARGQGSSTLLFSPADARLSLATSLLGLAIGSSIFPKPWTEHIWQLDELLEAARNLSTFLRSPCCIPPPDASLGAPSSSRPSQDDHSHQRYDPPAALDVEPAHSFEFVEEDASRTWAAPYRPNGPLIAQALLRTSLISVLASIPARLWRASRISNFLTWISQPSVFSASAVLLSVNALIVFGATLSIRHGRALTAPEPPRHEYALHERFYPVLMPYSNGTIAKSQKQTL